MKEKYKKIFIKYYDFAKKYIKVLYNNTKNYLLCSKNRRKNLTVIVSLIVLNLFLLVYSSNAYYYDEAGIAILHAVVGDIDSEHYDYVLKIYLENAEVSGSGNGNYHLSNSIPLVGYSYSKYTCKNNSTLIYDEIAKTASVTISEKDVCSIYFNLNESADAIININVEESVNSNTYEIVDKIPYYGYTYDHYSCKNNSELTYNSNLHKIILNPKQKDYCDVYFKKNNSDIIVNLFIEDNLDSESYSKYSFIPSDKLYTLNNDKTICKDDNDNTISVNINYIDGIINLDTASISYCDVYLDVSNE